MKDITNSSSGTQRCSGSIGGRPASRNSAVCVVCVSGGGTDVGCGEVGLINSDKPLKY